MDVYQLPPGDKTLDWYAEAVAAMKARNPTDPRSWVYQANVHGVNPLPAAMNGLWAECQHSTSFFLPWHRMYVLNFERIVAWHVADLGGPSDWALPYWNYTTSSPATLAIPPQFRNPKRANGAANPLYVPHRNPAANAGHAVLGRRDVDLACLRAAGTTAPGGFFGGVPSAHFGLVAGALELAPHNAVHVQVGKPTGWMADPDLAAGDPIFWLHHANIDRLWQVWLNCNPAHQNLSSAYWRSGVLFTFHDANGNPLTMKTDDVLDLNAPALDYDYQDASCPAPFLVPGAAPAVAASSARPAKPGGPGPVGTGTAMSAPQQELVGATHSAVQLGDKAVRVAVPTPVTPQAFHAARGMSATAAKQPVQQVTLQLEQVTSNDVAPTYDVFLNVPAGEDPDKRDDRFVGRVAMFGIKQASDPRGRHGGGGQNFAFDITRLYHELTDRKEIDPNNLHVSFVPVSPVDKPSVTVGRVSLYFA